MKNHYSLMLITLTCLAIPAHKNAQATEIIQINSSEHFAEVIENHDKVVVDFWAPWCGPCRMLAPAFEKVSNYPGNSAITFAKVNVDEQIDVASQYGIRSIPTMIFFKHGQAADQQVGAIPETNLNEWLQKAHAQ